MELEPRHWVIALGVLIIGFIIWSETGGDGGDEYSITVINQYDEPVMVTFYQDDAILCSDSIRRIDYCQWGDHDGFTHQYRAIVGHPDGNEAYDLTTSAQKMELKIDPFLTTFTVR